MFTSSRSQHTDLDRPRRPKILRRRILSTLALAFALLFGLAQNAYADVFAENSGVRGRANWTWGTTTLSGVYLAVRDLDCDGSAVYVNLYVYTTAPGEDYFPTTRRENAGGCGTVRSWSNLGVTANYRIRGVRVHACVNTGACALSEYHDNPLT